MDKVNEKTQFILTLAANNYGGIKEINDLLEDPTIETEDIKSYMKYCDQAQPNMRSVHCWRQFEQMKHIAKTKGIEKIMFREDVYTFTKFKEKYDRGEEEEFIRVTTAYGNFAISKARFIKDCS